MQGAFDFDVVAQPVGRDLVPVIAPDSPELEHDPELGLEHALGQGDSCCLSKGALLWEEVLSGMWIRGKPHPGNCRNMPLCTHHMSILLPLDYSSSN